MPSAGKPQISPFALGAPVATSRLKKQRRRLLVIIVVLIGIFYGLFAIRTFIFHYYPSPPFFYDEGDSLSDWTHTCSWSDRTDRYTTWQSLYTPFSHFICTIANLVFGQIPPDFFAGWRQFSPNMKFITLLHVSIWLTIFLPIKPVDKGSRASQVIKSYVLKIFPFRLLTFFSYSAMFSFERGNTLSVAYMLIWLSVRAAYHLRLRAFIHPILVGSAAAIKPYIILFSLYGGRLSGLVVALTTAVLLQIIPVLIVGAPGIENWPANIAYFSKENSIMDVLAKAVHSFSFRSYLDMTKLVHYGIGTELLGVNYEIYLNILFITGAALYALLIVIALRCLTRAIMLNRGETRVVEMTTRLDTSCESNEVTHRRVAREVLLIYAIPMFIIVMVFMVFSQASGPYVILFLLVPIFCIEEETYIISKSPILLSLYFLSICAFDLPALTTKAYMCGVGILAAGGARGVPLISELTGKQFICLGTFIGPISLARPILFLLFGCFLLLKLTYYISINSGDDMVRPENSAILGSVK